jgi:hypothetical protein
MTDIIYYVDTAASPGGDGLSPGTAYQSLQEANEARAGAISSGDRVIIKCSASNGDRENQLVRVNGWSPSDPLSLIFEGEPNPTPGVWNESIYRLDVDEGVVDANSGPFFIESPNCWVDNFQVYNRSDVNGTFSKAIRLLSPQTKACTNSIVRLPIKTPNAAGEACVSSRDSNGNTTCTIYNNLFIGGRVGFHSPQTATNRVDIVYNNTGYGMKEECLQIRNKTSVFCKNNIAFEAWHRPFWFQNIDNLDAEKNSTEQQTGEGADITGINYDFVDVGGLDFHLGENSEAIGLGIGQSLDSNVPQFDIDGDERTGDTTDLGYDLFVSAKIEQANLDEIFYVSDENVGVATLIAQILENFLASYQAQSSEISQASIDENIYLSDDFSSLSRVFGAVLESISANDSFNTLKNVTALWLNNISAGSSFGSSANALADILESISIDDEFSTFKIIVAEMINIISCGDNFASISNQIASIQENINLSDQQVAIVSAFSSLIEGLSVRDILSFAGSQIVEIVNSIRAGDTMSATAQASSLIQEVIELSDSKDSIKRLVDSIIAKSQYNDFVNAVIRSNIVVMEALELNGVFEGDLSGVADIVHTIEVNDEFSAIIKRFADLVGVVNISDAIAAVLITNMVVTSSISLSEAVAAFVGISEFIDESIFLNDEFQADFEFGISQLRESLAVKSTISSSALSFAEFVSKAIISVTFESFTIRDIGIIFANIKVETAIDAIIQVQGTLLRNAIIDD